MYINFKLDTNKQLEEINAITELLREAQRRMYRLTADFPTATVENETPSAPTNGEE